MKKTGFGMILLCVLSSCLEKDSFPVEVNYQILPSEYLTENLDISAKGIPRSYYDRPAYTGFQDVYLEVYALFDESAFEKGVKTNEQLNAFDSWGRSVLTRALLADDAPMSFTTSFISGGVAIRSNVSLYDEVPGTNIASHFKVLRHPWIYSYNGAILQSKDYSVVYPVRSQNLPVEIDEYFFDGFVLYCTSDRSYAECYAICFKDEPAIVPTDVTLTIEIPVLEELRFSAYKADGSFDADAITYRERVLSGSVQLSFSNN